MGDSREALEPRATPLRYKISLEGARLSALAVVTSNPLSSTKTNPEDPRLGPSTASGVCGTCGQTLRDCPTHLMVYMTYPIPVPIVISNLVAVAGIICSECSRIPITAEERDALPKTDGAVSPSTIAGILARKPDNYVCPHCPKELRVFRPVGFPIGNTVNYQQPALFYTDKPRKNEAIIKERVPFHKLPIVDNDDLWKKLKNIPIEDVKLLGYDVASFHPGQFISNMIPIASALIRQKASTSSKYVGGNTRRLHTAIEDYQVALKNMLGNRKISEARKELEGRPSEFYDIVMTVFRLYYVVAMLQTSVPDPVYMIIQKELNLGAQKAVSVINMLPKKKGIMRRLLAGIRHDEVARSPLAGYTYGATGTATLPVDFAMKVTVPMRVTVRNIELCRALVRNGPSLYPGANAYIRNGATFNLSSMNLRDVARSLLPGDVIVRHTITGDIALHQRYPSIREESIDASIIVVSKDNLIRLPLSTCLKKTADFDGDDTQFFFFSVMAFAGEALLLQSVIQQFIAASDGKPAVGVVDDALIGWNYLLRRSKFTQQEANALFSSTHSGKRAPTGKKEYTTNELFEALLPKEFDYREPSGKLAIEGGKIVGGKLEVDCFSTGKGYLLQALCNTIDPYAAIELLEDVTRIGYMTNDIFGAPFADDLRRKEPQISQIREMVKDTYRIMDEYADKYRSGKLVIPVGQNPEEYYERMQLNLNADAHYRGKDLPNGKKAPSAEVLLKEMMIGSTFDKLGLVQEFLPRLKSAMVCRGQVQHMQRRPSPRLAHNSRHLVWYPRGDDSPAPSGFISRGYLDKLLPIDHFNEAAEQRWSSYLKGAGISEQGYFNRKICASLGSVYMGHFGEVRGPSGSVIAYSYGHLGGDPRHSLPVKIDAHIVSDAEFKKRYDGVPEEMAELLAIRQDWRRCISIYSRITSDEKFDPTSTAFESVIDLDSILGTARRAYKLSGGKGVEKGVEKGSGKTITQAEAWAILKDTRDQFAQMQHGPRAGPLIKRIVEDRVRSFMRIFRFICPSARFVREKWSKAEMESAMTLVVRKYILALCDAGDPIGMKIALNVAWPFTQLVLHATRGLKSGGGSIDLIKRTGGTKLFREVMEGTMPKNALTSFFLKGDKSKSYTESFDMAKRLTSVRLKDVAITANMVSISPDLLATTSDCSMSKLRDWLKNVPDGVRKSIGQRMTSWFYYVFHLDSYALLLSKADISQISVRLQRAYPDLIEFAVPIYENEKGMYLFLNVKSQQSMEEMKAGFTMLLEKAVIHGHPSFYNGSVAVYNGKPRIDDSGALVTEPVFRILLNGSNLPYLLTLPDIDQPSISTSDIGATNELLGISEAMFRSFEVLAYEASSLSSHAAVQKKHLDVLVHYMAYRGTLTFIPRASMGANPDIDLIEKMIFETAGTFLAKSLHDSKYKPIGNSFSTSIIMGRVPKIGSGISEVLFRTSDLYRRRADDKSKQIMTELTKGKAKPKVTKKAATFMSKIPLPIDVVDKEIDLSVC